MNIEEIGKGVNSICETSIEVAGYFSSIEKLVSKLNSVSKENLNELKIQFENRNGPIVELRKEVVDQLLNGIEFTNKSFEEIIAKHKKGNENKFRVFKNPFSIFFPLITIDYEIFDQFSSKFISEIIKDLGLNNIVKSYYSNFTGPRNQGSNILWYALYNKAQKKQSSSLQIFINFIEGRIEYGIYKHGNRKYLVGPIKKSPAEFKYEDMISFLNKNKEIIINDTKIESEIDFLDIGEKNIYKVSMGEKQFTDVAFDEFMNRNVIVVNRDTYALATSKITQGKIFENMNIGDYFYLTRSNTAIKIFGKVIANSILSRTDGYTDSPWLEIKFEVIRKSLSENSYKGLKKWWTPNSNSTCVEIKKDELEEANKLIFEPYFNLKILNSNKEIVKINPKNRDMRNALNTILYGPPGTGKTFSTKNKSISILTNFNKEDKILIEEEKQKQDQDFDNLYNEGRIKFITFHPSYSYEDFIEGLRPVIDKNENGPVRFELKDGIFKQICLNALNEYVDENKLKSWKEFEENLSNINLKVTEKLKREKDEEEFEVNRYVLIIDEINRGDISKIFGELITLIEEDKRIGKSNKLIVQLPYSGDKFGIPPNLYIVGTMNTADRSLALLDIALRRRFDFIEMNPEFDGVENNPEAFGISIDIEKLKPSIEAVKKINIILGENPDIGKDKKIGHAYFCNIDDEKNINSIWKNKILPLIEEYYFFDKDNLRGISGGKYQLSSGWDYDKIEEIIAYFQNPNLQPK